jgi:hypothetical protein
MQLYMSGTPRNDAFQTIENRFCKYRLFSIYADYAPAVMNWVESIRDELLTVDDFFQRRPSQQRILANRDREYRNRLRKQGDEREWVPLEEVLRRVCASRTGSYPRHIMLDSGAFTAWNAGKSVSLDQVREHYARFLESGDGLFDEVWLINLDVITDDTMTGDEKKAATERSDENFRILRSEFGNCVLPVFHQREGKARLREVIEQADGYLCLSPTNKIPEDHRWRWALLANSALRDLGSKARAHGLATTGNVMIREAKLFSGDSGAWVEHGKFGTVDLMQLTDDNYAEIVHLHRFHDRVLGREIRKLDPLLCYRNYHISSERDDFDHKVSQHLPDNVRDFSHLSDHEQRQVVDQVEGHGFPFVAAQWIERVRSLICMAELDQFASQAGEPLSEDAKPVFLNNVYSVL